MKKFPTWDEFVERKGQVNESVTDNSDFTGEPLDGEFRDDAEYRKLLDFLKGKKNVPSPVKPPKEAAKGWFVVDETSNGVWISDGWTEDPQLIPSAVIDSENAAYSLAKLVGGTVVSAEEILG